MVNRGICALKVNVRGEAVATRGNGIFESELQVGNGASTGVALAEPFLGLREQLVGLCIVRGDFCEEASPQLVQTVSQTDGAVVKELSGISLFVKEDSSVVQPRGWSVAENGHALK